MAADGIDTKRSLCSGTENDDKTLKELQLEENMEVYVWTVPPDDPDTSQPDVEPGFGGTALRLGSA
jgi:hypothetical protein